MSQSRGLDTLIELAQQRCDTAATSLGRLNAEHSRETQQYEALCRYRREYRQHMDELLMSGARPAELENYRRFLGSLDRAIQRQRENLDESEYRVDGGQRHWQQERVRLRSYDVLSERRNDSEQRTRNRQEQLSMDECAQRIARTANSRTGS